MSASETLTLERAIEQLITLGEGDPHAIFSILERQLGEDDLVRLARPYLADMVAEMARHKIASQRRSAVARITGKALESREVLLKSLWVPTGDGAQIVYKRINDMTADDFEARAAFLETMVVGIRRHAQWCRDCALAIRSSSIAVTAGQLDALPPLPEIGAMS